MNDFKEQRRWLTSYGFVDIVVRPEPLKPGWRGCYVA